MVAPIEISGLLSNIIISMHRISESLGFKHVLFTRKAFLKFHHIFLPLILIPTFCPTTDSI